MKNWIDVSSASVDNSSVVCIDSSQAGIILDALNEYYESDLDDSFLSPIERSSLSFLITVFGRLSDD